MRFSSLVRIRYVGASALAIAMALKGCASQPTGGDGGGSTLRPSDPNAPLNTPAGVTQSVQVVAGLLPLGTVPYDYMVLPMVSPDGTRIAVQTGAPPTWNTLLAEADAEVPTATKIEIYQPDWRRDIDPAKRLPPALLITVEGSLLLGRSCDAEGFLVESARDDGSRWIGKAAWETGSVEWLVKDSNVNAFGALGPDGKLAWSRRAVGVEHFDLVVSANGSEWSVPALNDSWLLPTWPNPGDGLFVFNLAGKNLDVCHGRAGGETAFVQSLQKLPLVDDGSVLLAYQAISAQSGACDIRSPVRDQLVYFHPARSRMALWRPLAAPGRKATVVYSGSIAALVDQEDFAFTTTASNLIRQNLNNKAYMELVPGTHVPRATTSPDWPFILLCPAEGTVGVMGLRLLPRDSAVFGSRSQGK